MWAQILLARSPPSDNCTPRAMGKRVRREGRARTCAPKAHTHTRTDRQTDRQTDGRTYTLTAKEAALVRCEEELAAAGRLMCNL